MYIVTPLVGNIFCAQELTNDRLVSEADLARLLGTLRYLQGLKLHARRWKSVQQTLLKLLKQLLTTLLPASIMVGHCNPHRLPL